MKVETKATAGTMESSDVQVTVEPASSGVKLELSSGVMEQYGRQIREVVLETLSRLGVESANVVVVDKGALDCTIRARVECAVFRASIPAGAEGNASTTLKIPWGGVVRE